MDEKVTTEGMPAGGECAPREAENALRQDALSRPKRGAGKVFRPAVLRLLVRLTVFAVFGLVIVLLVLYCAGSWREVPDREQSALVRLILAFSVLLWVSAFCGAILDLWYGMAFKKAAPLAGSAGYLSLVLLGTVIAMGAGFILSVAGGNR
jgi:hypothetical protein